ncbi:MAG: tyrosine-type recombinase/integrase [Mangrovibacterium sp.]
MNIKRNINFKLESRKKKGVAITKNVPIRMRVTFASQRLEFSTGYRIDSAKWDENKQRVKNGCTNKVGQTAPEINADLFTYYADMQAIFKEFEMQEIVPTPEMIKEAFNKKNDDYPDEEEKPQKVVVKPPTLLEVIDKFTSECGKQNDWSRSSYQKFEAMRNHIKEFLEKPTFDYFTEEGLNNYVDFFRHKKGMRNSTIGKQLGYFKWFFRWAAKKGYHSNMAFDTFKPKLKTTSKKVIFLTHDEIEQVKAYPLPRNKQYLARVRDVFLFCCFTGLRYSDAYNLRRSDVKENHIEVTTVKTADSLVIELNKHSKAILDKYEAFHFEDDKVLPVVSNQKMNQYLKELGEIAGIDEPIRETYYVGNERVDEISPKYSLLGTHTGRRTFICNALSLGIPAQVVMKWTGHSDYKSMKPYIDVADNIKASEMGKFDNF